MPEKNPVTIAIVGAGHRAVGMASYSERHPDEMQVVAIAEPREHRRNMIAERFNIPEDMRFATAEELAAKGRVADAVINGTMDQHHVPTSLPLLEQGYDLLLEKPFATSMDEMWQLVQTARKHGNRVMICHVLRFAPFYAAIRKRVAEGVIGDVLNVQAVEHVSYHHMQVGFIHGKWSRKSWCGSSMLMSKSCHDMDLIAWMKSGIKPKSVSSFGGNLQFRPERAPKGAGTRCLVDCPADVEKNCHYSARKLYVDHPERWSFYVWDCLEHIENPTLEDKIHSLKTDNPYGRCAWKSDMDVVDHQSIAIEFEDGTTGTFNLVGGASKALRSMHIIGTEGEIQGDLEDGTFVVRHMEHGPDGPEYVEETVDPAESDKDRGGHGGGDERLVADFVRVLRGEEPSLSTTSLDDSVNGHLLGFSADQAMEEHRVVDLEYK